MRGGQQRATKCRGVGVSIEYLPTAATECCWRCEQLAGSWIPQGLHVLTALRPALHPTCCRADLADLEGRHTAHVANLMASHEAAYADMRTYYNQASVGAGTSADLCY